MIINKIFGANYWFIVKEISISRMKTFVVMISVVVSHDVLDGARLRVVQRRLSHPAGVVGPAPHCTRRP